MAIIPTEEIRKLKFTATWRNASMVLMLAVVGFFTTVLPAYADVPYGSGFYGGGAYSGSVPVLTTGDVTTITQTEATLNGIIQTIGTTTPTIRGFVYGTTTSYGSSTVDNAGPFGTGAFAATISSLTCGTSYHAATYARNLSGVGYGADVLFSTLPCTVTTATSVAGAVIIPSHWTALPSLPTGGFRISLNEGALTTANRSVRLSSNASPDVAKIAISFSGDFTDAVQEAYQPVKQIDLCSQTAGFIKNSTCPDGEYTVYVKFYTQHGVASNVFSQKINLLASFKPLEQSVSFTKNLKLGSKGDDVRRLQNLLSTKPDIYPEALTTGYFGILTKKAVQKFQLQYSVVSSYSDSGFGVVGPKTRVMLMKIFKDQ